MFIRAAIRLGHVARFASSGSFGDGYPQLALWLLICRPNAGFTHFHSKRSNARIDPMRLLCAKSMSWVS